MADHVQTRILGRPEANASAEESATPRAAERNQVRLARLLEATTLVQVATTEHEVLTVVASAIRASGWDSVGAHLYRNWEIAETIYAGLSEEEIALLHSDRPSPRERASFFGPERDRFKVSRSYMIPSEKREAAGLPEPVRKSREPLTSNPTWLSCDVAYVPMSGPDGEVIGAISLDDPVDGQRPDEQTFRYTEYFADLAAATIAKLRLEEERVRTDEALRESEEKWRSVVENAPNQILILDRRGVIQFVNRAFCGRSVSDVLQTPFLDYFPPEDSKDLGEDLESVFRFGANFRCELAGSAPDGEEIWYQCLAGPQRKDGDVVAVTLTAVDVTETRKLRDLEASAQRLEAAGRIAGQVAHDFNNLLAPLVGYPDLIRELLDADHPILPFLGRMEQSSRRIAEINQQLLTMGRRGHYNQLSLSLNRIVRNVLEEVQPLPAEVVCEIELATDLMNIKGGEAQLSRAVANLVHNAVEAMDGSGTLSISTANRYMEADRGGLSGIPSGEYAELAITDTGCGIPDGVLDRVFEPFFTTKSPDNQRGSGLGLSIVDGVIIDHRGHLDLQTRVGEGTTFRLHFPITREPIDERLARELVGGTESILVIDDDPVQRRVSKNLLRALGYDVQIADSGEEALEMLREEPRDLLVLDMVMDPGIDGAETYRRVCEFRSDQKAIIVSGYSETARVEEALCLGVGAFVKKPLSLDVLARAVRAELDARSRS